MFEVLYLFSERPTPTRHIHNPRARAITSPISRGHGKELELELIQTQMTQKPMLRAEVYARALRASQNRKEDSL